MSRSDRRALQSIQRRHVAKFPRQLTPVSPEEWPTRADTNGRIRVWRSSSYLVQLFEDPQPGFPDALRLSINRATMRTDLNWQEDLTWEELQDIKRAVGFGDCYALEVYPPDRNLVNVANMRHLWLLPSGLSIGWLGA